MFCPVTIDLLSSSIDMLFNGTFTWSSNLSVFPFTVETEIVVFPLLTAVTFPSSETVATFVLVDLYVTLLSSASSGAIIVSR